MDDGELLNYMGIDAKRWAEEFCKIARDEGHHLDEEWMFRWFANAIMTGYDRGRAVEPTIPPETEVVT